MKHVPYKRKVRAVTNRSGEMVAFDKLVAARSQILAKAIQWQRDPTPYGTPPPASSKVALAQWSRSEKADLERAFVRACRWLATPKLHSPPPVSGLTDEPVNLCPYAITDAAIVDQWVATDYMWKLYIAHVAFALALEQRRVLPWSILSYPPAALRYLFDSTTMAWRTSHYSYAGQFFRMGTSWTPPLRADNLPMTAFAGPQWTYGFLAQQALIGATRLETLCRVLEWMRANMWHYSGSMTYGNAYGIWQYRGFPPLSKIAAGTIDVKDPAMGVKHWTAGCHGSVGFLAAVLRVANIPVQPVWVCSHELAYFPTERRYLDHGDDPYNANVRASSQPIVKVLIDEPTYAARFSTDPTTNVLVAAAAPECLNVGLAAAQFPP